MWLAAGLADLLSVQNQFPSSRCCARICLFGSSARTSSGLDGEALPIWASTFAGPGRESFISVAKEPGDSEYLGWFSAVSIPLDAFWFFLVTADVYGMLPC